MRIAYEKERAQHDFLYFLNHVLGYKDVVADIHKEIANNLTHSFTRGLIMIPRKHLKTCQITVGWTLWMLTNNPNLRFGIGSATEKLSKDIVNELKTHIMDNQKFKELFGDWYKKGGWTAFGFTIAPREEIYKNKSVEVFSVGKDVTGAHYDIIILDDLAIRKNSDSPTMREKQINLYKDCLDLIVDDQEKKFMDKSSSKGIILAVGTRWHFGDIYNYLLVNAKSSLDFVIDEPLMHNPTLELRDPDRWRSNIKELLYHEDTQMLFPEKFDITYARETYEEKGTYEFSCQQMNFPVSDEGAAFKAEDLIFDEPGVGKEFPANTVCDPAGDDSTYADADDWAITTCTHSPDGHMYVQDVWAKSKVSSHETLSVFASMVEGSKSQKAGMESNFTKAYLYIFKSMFPDLKRRLVSIKRSNVAAAKQRAVLALQPIVESHKLHIIQDEDGEVYPFMGKELKLSKHKQKLLEQLVDYGNINHEDCVDSLAMHLDLLKVRSIKRNYEYTYKPVNPITGY